MPVVHLSGSHYPDCESVTLQRSTAVYTFLPGFTDSRVNQGVNQGVNAIPPVCSLTT
jgi:hypothetical protein